MITQEQIQQTLPLIQQIGDKLRAYAAALQTLGRPIFRSGSTVVELTDEQRTALENVLAQLKSEIVALVEGLA